MSQPHLHLSSSAIYPSTPGASLRFRHAAIFGAIDALQPAKRCFVNDHDPFAYWAIALALRRAGGHRVPAARARRDRYRLHGSLIRPEPARATTRRAPALGDSYRPERMRR